MVTKEKVSNTKVVAILTKRIQGLGGIPAKQAIQIDGTAYTAAEVIGIFQANLDTLPELTAAQAEVKRAQAAFYTAKDAALAVDAGLKRWTIAVHGATSQLASELGYEPRKQPVRSVDSKVRAVAQALATRKARGTIGPKAKLKIKGTVVVPSVPAPPASTTLANGVH